LSSGEFDALIDNKLLLIQSRLVRHGEIARNVMNRLLSRDGILKRQNRAAKRRIDNGACELGELDNRGRSWNSRHPAFAPVEWITPQLIATCSGPDKNGWSCRQHTFPEFLDQQTGATRGYLRGMFWRSDSSESAE